VQGSLLAPMVDRAKRDRLMATLDQLNRHLRPDAVKFGALGLNPTCPPGRLLFPTLHHPLAGVSHGDTLGASTRSWHLASNN
jgi:hypothetical protein